MVIQLVQLTPPSAIAAARIRHLGVGHHGEGWLTPDKLSPGHGAPGTAGSTPGGRVR